MRKALAIDVGGTKIYSAIINEKGEIISEIEKHHTPKTFDEIKSLFEAIIKRHEDEVEIIAFATCGTVNNTNDGILGSTGNIVKKYPSMDFKSLSNKPVFVENDANAAAWAEHIIGSSKGMPYSVMLTLGTGVGGGIILDNKLYKGKNGAAGEMHFKMRTDKHRKCTCGSFDCFEAYASGTGLKKTAEEISGNSDITTYDVIWNLKCHPEPADLRTDGANANPDSEQIEQTEQRVRALAYPFNTRCSNARMCKEQSSVSVEQIQDDSGYINANDKTKLTDYDSEAGMTELCKQIFNTWQNDILEGIIGLANIFDPDVIVLSGSMAEFVDIEYLEKEANKEIVTTPFKVLKASAGNYSGMIGAALLALGVK